MSGLQITYGTDWMSMFLAGLPPKDITEKQWKALGELASIHAKRTEGQHPNLRANVNLTGGWGIVARPAEFVELHNIAGAILAHHYGTLADYRDEPQA